MDVTHSKATYNHFRTVLGNSIRSYRTKHQHIRDLDINLNQVHAPAVKMYVLLVIAKIFFQAAGASTYSNTPGYRRFKARLIAAAGANMSKPHAIRLIIGELIEKLAAGQEPMPTSELLTRTELEEALGVARNVVAKLDRAIELTESMPTMVVQLIFYKTLWLYVADVTGLPWALIEPLVSTAVHVDDVHVIPDESHFGRDSVLHGTSQLPGPFVSGYEATDEGGMMSISMLNGHVRFLIGCTSHVKSNPGPILGVQLQQAFDAMFFATGIRGVVKTVNSDHAAAM